MFRVENKREKEISKVEKCVIEFRFLSMKILPRTV